MAEPATTTNWTTRGAWADCLADGQFGVAGTPGVTARTLDGLGIATLIDGGAALAAAVRERLGIALPDTPMAIRSGKSTLVWAGPDQWLLVCDDRAGFADTLAALSGLSAVSDQSDGRAALRLSGPKIREALAKGCMVDLHPAAFPIGATALTSIAHMGVHLWRTDDGPDGAVFEIMIARSMAGSFWSWFSASAAEFGCRVLTKGPTTGRG